MKKNTLKKQLLIHFGVISFTLVALMVFIVMGMNSVKKAEDVISKENAQQEKLYEAKAAHYKWSNHLLSSIYSESEFSGSLDPTGCDFGKFIYSDEVQNNPMFQSILKEIEPVHNAIHNSAKVITANAKTDKEKAVTVYNKETVPNIEVLIKLLDTAIADKEKMIVAEEQKYNRIILRVTIISILEMFLVFAVCVKLYMFISKEIMRNLKVIGTQIGKLAKGQLSLDLSCQCRTSEMDDMKEALKFSVEELSKYVKSIAYGMGEFAAGNFTIECPVKFLGDFAEIETSIGEFRDKISYIISECGTTSGQVRDGAEQVASGSQSLAQGATEQASSVEQLSATISEISGYISQNAENSKRADSLGKETGEVIDNSIREMRQMLEAINEIQVSSEGIGRIIKVIDDIAFQTNILALNAAVEAARAGEAGKGFAVVADEVRNLAQKSSEAAKDTTALIEKSIQSVQRGNEIAKAANLAFGAVAEKSTEVLSIVGEIAVSSNEQAMSVRQVSQGIDQISSVVHMNSATSEESAAASDELSRQANALRELIGQFKIKN